MVVAIIIGTGIAYYYVDVLLDILLAPAGKLYYMRPTEAFFTYMKVSIVGGNNFGIAYHTASNMATLWNQHWQFARNIYQTGFYQ